MNYFQLLFNELRARQITLVGLLCLSMGFSLSANALSTDRDQPAEIEADDIEFDFKKGTRTYIDNVLVIQGTLRLKADRVDALYVDSELEKATAIGSLARFKQRPDGKKDDVEGWAKKIIVNQKQNTLTLIGKAALKQGPDTAVGETIVYNMATDTLKVSGGAKLGASGKDGSRVPKRTLQDPFSDNNQGPVTAPPSAATPNTATPNTAVPGTAVPSAAAPSAAVPSAAVPSAAVPSAAAPSAAAPSAAVPGAATPVVPPAGAIDPNTGRPYQVEQAIPPIKAGRSRLILQPKD